jgi:hypothetical protein
MMNQAEYIPGVCNIGRAEIVARRRAGWIGLVLTIVIWLALIFFRLGPVWLLLLFLSASLSASGFIQAKMHFCAAFGMRHIFNFSPQVGNAETVMQKELWAADRRKALQIGAYSVFVGLAVMLAALLLRRLV